MKKFSKLIVLFLFCIQQNHAQQNCSNPTLITICPDVSLNNQTNAGMIDDATASCNIPGEDVLYEINVVNGAAVIYVSVTNAIAPMLLNLETGTCGSGSCSSIPVPPGDKNFTFNVTAATSYFLWVDASTTVTYDISFGADTGSIFVNIPNTQGNLQFDASGCASPMFSASKPFFQVSYNGVYQTNPMTLAPLFVNGTLCIVAYFENTSGIEGIKKFDFHFNAGGYTSVSASPAIIPGNYNAGNWTSTNVGNDWSFEFFDVAGIGQGDFFLFPNTCLRYEFCFDVTPLTNDPALTNVDITATSDGFGAGYTGFVNSGCCPAPFLNCLYSGGGGPGTSPHAFGFAFDDPGGPLPIGLLSFDAVMIDYQVEVKWITQSETNNDYFTLQKSANGTEWTNLVIIDGAGNSTSILAYQFTDRHPFPTTSYYRLKQTDFDGTSTCTNAIAVDFKSENKLLIYPNPTKGDVTIQYMTSQIHGASEIQNTDISVFNIIGEQLKIQINKLDGDLRLNLSNIEDGLYLVEVTCEGNKTYQKIIIQHQ